MKSQNHQKAYYDANRKCKFQVFEVDEEVLVCDIAARSKYGKLHSPWTGPHTIMEKLSDALYRVRFDNGKEKVVNSDKIKKFYPRSDSTQEHTDEESEESDEEDNDILATDDEEETELQPQEVQAVPASPTPVVREQATQPIMGKRGELWCNLDKKNVVVGKRRKNSA